MMEAVALSTSETSLSLCEATWRNIPEDSYLYIRHRDNLMSYLFEAFSDMGNNEIK
jgi:hypothetical protein